MPQSKRRKPKHAGPTVSKKPALKVRSGKPSPTWYVVVMASMMGLGVLAVLSAFIFSLGQFWVGGGLVGIAIGFFMTTNYR